MVRKFRRHKHDERLAQYNNRMKESCKIINENKKRTANPSVVVQN